MEDNRMTDAAQDPLLRLTDAERLEMSRLLEEGKLPYEELPKFEESSLGRNTIRSFSY
jgi:hypothetical protein